MYFEYDESTGISELSFENPKTGHYIFARMMKADEWTDIMTNMAVDFTNAREDTEVMGHRGLITTTEEDGIPIVVGMWFDSNEKIMYALAVGGEDAELTDYSKDLFHPSKVK